MKCILRNVISSVLKYQIKIIPLCIEKHVFCNGIAFWCVAFEWWLHIYATKISLFACLILRYTCMFFQDPATTIRLYMYETMIWSQNKVVSWCVNFFGTHHLSYCSCVILHHIYPIIVYTLILSVVMGRGGGWQARGAVFYEKKLKQINSHIQSNLDIQDYFNGMTRNGVKKIISKIQNNQMNYFEDFNFCYCVCPDWSGFTIPL